jgi:hypothetical protein
VKVFYARLEKGFVIASGFNKGHAVKNINKELEVNNISTDFKVEEVDLEKKKGFIALVWGE